MNLLFFLKIFFLMYKLHFYLQVNRGLLKEICFFTLGCGTPHAGMEYAILEIVFPFCPRLQWRKSPSRCSPTRHQMQGHDPGRFEFSGVNHWDSKGLPPSATEGAKK